LIGNPKSQIRNPKFEIRNSKSEIRNPKFEIRNSKSEIPNPKSEIRNPMIGQAKRVLDELLQSRIIPETKPGDALQMAISAAHEVDYLLTWNYAHLANPVAQERLEEICRSQGLRAPLLVSPETIPQVRFGQTILRRKS